MGVVRGVGVGMGSMGATGVCRCVVGHHHHAHGIPHQLHTSRQALPLASGRQHQRQQEVAVKQQQRIVIFAAFRCSSSSSSSSSYSSSSYSSSCLFLAVTRLSFNPRVAALFSLGNPNPRDPLNPRVASLFSLGSGVAYTHMGPSHQP